MSESFRPREPIAFVAIADLHRREATIRIGGLLVIPPAVLAFLFVASHLDPSKPDPSDFWTVKLLVTMAVCLLAAFTGWGLSALERWSRWALSFSATAFTPVSMYLLWMAFRVIRRDQLWVVELAALVAGTSWIPLLIILWSPNGRAVFSPEHRRAVGKGRWGGWAGVAGALAFAGLESVAYLSMLASIFYLIAAFGSPL